MKKIYLIALAVIGFSANSFAQVSADATATATIITPIAISKTVDMNFGNIAVGTTSGTVILPPTGARAATGGVTLPNVVGTVSAASFSVTGAAGSTYVLTLPTNVVLSSGGSPVMNVDAFTSSLTASTGTIAGAPSIFTVGATLTVAASQAAGTYLSATPFTVTVNYN